MFDAPKLSHAMYTAFVCIVLIAFGAYVPKKLVLATNVGAFIFAVITAIVLYMLIVRTRADYIEVMEHFAKTYGSLNDEARAAMAFQFPALRYRMRRGKVREMFEDTQVTVEQFRLFLQTSNRRYISPERDWGSADKPRAAWTEIRDWLEVNEYILPDSAAGSHSWLWRGNSYDHLFAYWMAGRTLRDLSDMDMETA